MMDLVFTALSLHNSMGVRIGGATGARAPTTGGFK